MARLQFSPAAESDLAATWDYLAARNPAAARAVLLAIRNRCRVLAEHPFAGRPRPELDSELRSYAAGDYLIFYAATEEEVTIIRVLHGARDIEAAFRPR
jgi:toxin ParE1/3/4